MIRRSSPSWALLAAAVLTLPVASAAQTFKVEKFSTGGDGGHDYITAEAGTGRVFISRGTHVMVVDGTTGKVLGDIPDTPRMHGVALAPRSNHGFTTNAGDSTVSMFDLQTLALIKKIPTHTGGLDGIMYDDFSNRIVLTNHSRPIGTVTLIDAGSGEIVGTVNLEDTAPEGAASDGKGKLFVNNEGTSTLQVIDEKSMKAVASWPLAPCDGPTGIAYERSADRIFSGCSDTSVVVDAKSGKIVAKLKNGTGVDALGYDPSQKLIYIPAGGSGNVTVVHMDSPDKYTVVATVTTAPGVKTIAVDPVTHKAYGFVPEYGPAPAPAAGVTPPAGGRGGRAPRGPVIGGSLYVISH
jgi:DNA-binding beta-propeller fold protein YncE